MIDLHSHSNHSDGSLTPQDLVRYAHQCGIKRLALTDHDTISGVLEAQNEAHKLGMEFICGVEISVSWKKHVIHIVGLGIDISDQNLIEALDIQQNMREERAIAIGEELANMGLDTVYPLAKELAKDAYLTRTHFAKALVKLGFAKNFSDAFKTYLKRGKRAYVHIDWLSLTSAVEIIIKSGGKAVIAHPLRYDLTKTKLKELIVDFKLAGGEGIEVVNSFPSVGALRRLETLCVDYDLLASLGSDYHGHDVNRVRMGALAQLPEKCKLII